MCTVIERLDCQLSIIPMSPNLYNIFDSLSICYFLLFTILEGLIEILGCVFGLILYCLVLTITFYFSPLSPSFIHYRFDSCLCRYCNFLYFHFYIVSFIYLRGKFNVTFLVKTRYSFSVLILFH